MSTSKKIRLVSECDSESILDIYAPFIRNTVITFEYEVPTVPEFNQRILDIQKKYPWLVCEMDHRIVGYAYASQFNQRAAYDWSVDFSIYVHSDYHRRKVATALYYSLYEFVKLQGFYNAYAGIALPNIKSETFHTSFGFEALGTYHNVGYKFGKWHDVKWFERKITEHEKIPKKLKTVEEIKNTPKFDKIIEIAEAMIAECNKKF